MISCLFHEGVLSFPPPHEKTVILSLPRAGEESRKHEKITRLRSFASLRMTFLYVWDFPLLLHPWFEILLWIAATAVFLKVLALWS